MRRYWFIAVFAIALTASEAALACRMEARIVLDDVRKADVVVIGRVSNYRIIRTGPTPRLGDYARFEIQVDEVLVGRAPGRIPISWDNSTFGEPETLGAGPFLIALRGPSSNPGAEPGAFELLQAPCSEPFLFDSTGRRAAAVRRILAR